MEPATEIVAVNVVVETPTTDKTTAAPPALPKIDNANNTKGEGSKTVTKVTKPVADKKKKETASATAGPKPAGKSKAPAKKTKAKVAAIEKAASQTTTTTTVTAIPTPIPTPASETDSTVTEASLPPPPPSFHPSSGPAPPPSTETGKDKDGKDKKDKEVKKAGNKNMNDIADDASFQESPLAMLVTAASNQAIVRHRTSTNNGGSQSSPMVLEVGDAKSSAVQRQSPLPELWKDELLYMPTKQLNQYLKQQRLDPQAVMKLKVARRRIKNRIYTRQSRGRKVLLPNPTTPNGTPLRATSPTSATGVPVPPTSVTATPTVVTPTTTVATTAATTTTSKETAATPVPPVIVPEVQPTSASTSQPKPPTVTNDSTTAATTSTTHTPLPPPVPMDTTPKPVAV